VSQNVPLVKAIHHCSFIVANTKKSLEFYTGILGLEVDECRPDLAYPGAWLNVGEMQIHLLEVENPDPVDNRPEHGGRDRHLALRVSDLGTIMQRLQQAGMAYTKSSSGRAALFCRDYDGNTIELVED
jgi:glyoxylase I family protein